MKTQTHFVLRATICALALFSLLSYPLTVFAGNNISVTVVCKGVAVAGVQVELIPKPPNTGNHPGYGFTTDKKGRVQFRNFTSGTYTIVVTCGAFTFTEEIFTGGGTNFSHKYVFSCCPTPPGAPPGPNPDDGLIEIDDKPVTPEQTAGSKAPSRAVAAHTGDWQPGDEVSFSFSGNVYGPSGEKQTQDDYTDHLVGIVDSQGNKTEIPWSKVIRYKVPEAATSVIASLMKRGTIIATANIPVYPKGTPLPIQLPPEIKGNSVAYPVSQIGQQWPVYAPNGGFSGDANKIKLRTRNKIDNATNVSNAVAASPRSALFNPQVKEPGSYEYTVIDEGRFEDSFVVGAVGITIDGSRAYNVNQEGTLAIIVALPPQADAQQKLISENFHVTIKMDTPRVLTFSNGQNEVVWSLKKVDVSGSQARKEFPVRAGTPGTFTITARAKTPGSVNPSDKRQRLGIFCTCTMPGHAVPLLNACNPGNEQFVHVKSSCNTAAACLGTCTYSFSYLCNPAGTWVRNALGDQSAGCY